VDTIFAPASGRGRAGVAVIRLSGPAAVRAGERLTGSGLPPPRQAALRTLRCPASGETLDRGLVLYFAAPASYTGEDVLELHVHGGRAVVAGVLEALATLPGLRAAEPGEFSRRAFANGRMDLTTAEAIADLTAAETAAQRRQALAQMGGQLARLYEGWRDRLVRVQALIEAEIDFSDQDLPVDFAAPIDSALASLAAEMRAHLADRLRGERLRDGIVVAVIGAANVGKSSLINAIARREVAIVSPIAGTTRDLIEVPLDLGGYPVILTDTAGLREGGDEIEREGIRRAVARARDADLRLAVFDLSAWPRQDAATVAAIGPGTLAVYNKADLAPGSGEATRVPGALAVSARTGAGLDTLVACLTAAVAACVSAAADAPPALTRVRHRQAVAAALEDIERAGAGVIGFAPAPELRAEHLRLAGRALGRITGTVDVDDVLDQIFRDFCIGK